MAGLCNPTLPQLHFVYSVWVCVFIVLSCFHLHGNQMSSEEQKREGRRKLLTSTGVSLAAGFGVKTTVRIRAQVSGFTVTAIMLNMTFNHQQCFRARQTFPQTRSKKSFYRGSQQQERKLIVCSD